MPIKIPNDLPARQELEQEGMCVVSESDAIRQDIRPLHIALLNLMPQKERTETQMARLIGSGPLQVELTLVTTGSYTPTNVSQKHMRDFYRPWESVSQEKFDGFIITGAPVEQMPFEDVFYWKELTDILDWTQTHVHQTLGLCWGAQAALYHFHGVPKHQLDAKLFGVFQHRVVTQNSAMLRGFNDSFPVPRRRPDPAATELLALPRPPDDRELGQRHLPDRALRYLPNRRGPAQPSRRGTTAGLERFCFRRNRPAPPAGHPQRTIGLGGRQGERAGADSKKDML